MPAAGPMKSSTETRPAACAGEAALLARARAGDAAAFEAIIRRNNRLLFRAARSVVADDDTAQDIVQETYLRLFTQLGTFRGEAALGTWLTRVALNLAISTRRKQQRTVLLDDGPQDSRNNAPHREDVMHHPLTPSRESPEAAAVRGQLRRSLQTAIDSLPDMYRQVFMLRAVQGMSVEDTAQCLDVSADVVKTRLKRARATLRDVLGPQADDTQSFQDTFAFAGARCDAVVAHVLATLQQQNLLNPQTVSTGPRPTTLTDGEY